MLSPQTLFADASKCFRAKKYPDALALLNRLLDDTKDAKVYALLAKTLLALGLREEAAQAYALAGGQGGSRAEDHYAEALKLYYELGKYDLALSTALPLIQKAQKDADLAFVVASLLLMLQDRESIPAFLPVLLESRDISHNNLALKFITHQPEQAENRLLLSSLIEKLPKNILLLGAHFTAQREVNDYVEIERLMPRIKQTLKTDPGNLLRAESPFYNIMWLENEALHKIVGLHTNPFPASNPKKRLTAPHAWGRKIRVGYLSSDFWQDHATMKLCGAMLEAHDRERFDITLFCYTDPKKLQDSAYRQKWGNIVSVWDMSDVEAAQTIRDHNIDILVEMKGHTRGGRAAILNQAVAPVQVAWLGFPGSTVNIDLDYIIGDHSVLPDKSKPHYWEKFCRLPESYQPNNPNQAEAEASMFSRAQAGLPEDAFVFGSFNSTRKISLETIDLWIRILKATPKSMLWLMVKSREAETNILRRITAAGVEAERVVFTKMVPYEAHLARITLADVGLDPFPCNGHTTSSEQLWAGLPVLTKKGAHFSARVTESLLRAIGLPEMIGEDEDDYLRIAVELYENPEKAAEYSNRLEQNRFVKPLYDAERYCRHLEAAFEMMADRARNGLAPDHIDVPALPPREGRFM